MTKIQEKNIAWFLPRPKKEKYKGGMPLYAEEWIIKLAKEILKKDEIDVLQLFSGMCKIGFRVDIKKEVKPDLIADAHNFADKINKKFDVVLADPPYSNEESKDLYNTPKLIYKKWTNEANKVLREGGLFIIYHKFVVPNPNAEVFYVEKRVFIGSRPWHLPRVVIFFKKRKREGERNVV